MNSPRFTVNKDWLGDVSGESGAKHEITHGAVLPRYPFHDGDDSFVLGRYVLISYHGRNFKARGWSGSGQKELLSNVNENDVSVA